MVVRVKGCRCCRYGSNGHVIVVFLLLNIGSFFRYSLETETDCPCGLVLRLPGYRSRGPGSFSGATRFSEK
jgi:hypothetical protein